MLRRVAQRLRDNAAQLALLDALDCGNPVSEMGSDVMVAAALLDFFAGLVTELKGDTIPMGPDVLNYTEREPLGVVARIVAFNHPLLFAMGKLAAPLAAGNAVIIKPPAQAPLSALRCAELIGDLLPPGVLAILPGGGEAGAALAESPDVDMIGLVGSIATGRKVMQAAAGRIKPVALELGGKNPFVACADVDPAQAARAIVDGMNFTWCGQSCGSTSRAFVHRDIYDEVCRHVVQACGACVPGEPTDPATTMGAMISAEHRDRVKRVIDEASGGRLLHGGAIPTRGVPAGGHYLEPTVYADVPADSALAREELFGPVLALMPWHDETAMLDQIRGLDVGLTAAIWTADLSRAHRLAREIDAGFVWINEVGKHFLGAPYGGVRQSGIGRDECWRDAVLHAGEECAREFPAGGQDMSAEYDYIIVGAGSAGCARGGLPRAGAGGRPLGSRSADPRAAGLGQDPAEAVARLGLRRRAGRARRRPRDRVRARQVVGGSSSTNAMAFVRGHPGDFARWARYGLDEWRFEDTLPYFRRLEDWEDGAGAERGGGGPCACSAAATRIRCSTPSRRRPGRRAIPGWRTTTRGPPAASRACRCRSARDGAAAPRPPAAGAAAAEPARGDRRACAGPGFRRRSRHGAALSARRPAADGAGAARGHPRRRRDQHASHPDAFGHRAGASAGTGRPVGAAGPSRRGRQSAGPHLGHRDGAAARARSLRARAAAGPHRPLDGARLGGEGFAGDVPGGVVGFVQPEGMDTPDLQFLLTAAPFTARPWLKPWRQPFQDGFAVRTVLLHPRSRGRITVAGADPLAAPLSTRTSWPARKTGSRCAIRCASRAT